MRAVRCTAWHCRECRGLWPSRVVWGYPPLENFQTGMFLDVIFSTRYEMYLRKINLEQIWKGRCPISVLKTLFLKWQPELQRSSQSSRVERKQILWVMKILNPKNRLVWFNWSKRADSLCLPASYSGADISLVLLNKHQLSMRLNVFIYVQKHFFFFWLRPVYVDRCINSELWVFSHESHNWLMPLRKSYGCFFMWPKRTERNATPSPNQNPL